MKQVLVFILIWSFLVVTGSILAANSQTRHHYLKDQLNSAGLQQNDSNNGGKVNVIR
jgi:hypothetical protein